MIQFILNVNSFTLKMIGVTFNVNPITLKLIEVIFNVTAGTLKTIKRIFKRSAVFLVALLPLCLVLLRLGKSFICNKRRISKRFQEFEQIELVEICKRDPVLYKRIGGRPVLYTTAIMIEHTGD
jgi:hypothetical protein